MRLLKIKILPEILFDFGLPDYFQIVNSIEIVQIYQYDRYNFFSLNKIQFKSQQIESIETALSNIFQVQSATVLEKKGSEILCIIKQRKSEGFWPALLSGSWALIPPIIINPHSTIISIISKDEDQFSEILDQLKIFKSIEILSASNVDETTAYLNSSQPRLTSRQREIMNYAQEQGFFDIPKKTSLGEIGKNFGISASAAGNHIQKAEKILMKFFFG